jgi:hypothetical protein
MSNWCHPPHAMRTKCACGKVIELRGAVGDQVRVCTCGRKHSKEPRSAFAPADQIIDGRLSVGKRKGGRAGCPGI